MNSASCPRTSGCRSNDESGRESGSSGGSITVIVAFLFLALTVLGLGLAFFVQVHLRMGAGRKNSVILDYASENGIKRTLSDIAERLVSGETLREISPQQETLYRSDMLSGGLACVEDVLDWKFPRRTRESWNSCAWESLTSCRPETIDDRAEFTSVSYGFEIDSEGSLTACEPRRASLCDACLRAMAGRLPLPCLPLLIDRPLTAEEASRYLTDNGIAFTPTSGAGPAPRLLSAENAVIPDFPEALLGKALRIRLFKPEDLGPAVIRRAIGLEPTNDPVPAGVYLIRDDLGLGGVFVQGDIDEMVTAVDGDWQALCFRAGENEWTLRFSPVQGKTSFASPGGAEFFDLVPAGIICVNGKILSLGGGAVDAGGRITMVTDDVRPSVLQGVGLTIISSEGVTITSHLVSQGVRWKDGIPYVKDGRSQLIVYSTGKDMASGENLDAGVTVAAGRPSGLVIQASLVARGKGVVVEGRGRTIDVLGGIQASNVTGRGNAVRITPYDGSPENAPVTARPMIYIHGFRVLEWREY